MSALEPVADHEVPCTLSFKNIMLGTLCYLSLSRVNDRHSQISYCPTGWTIGVLGFDSRRGLRICLFTTVFRKALRPTQPPIQWLPGVLSLGVKPPGREADHSPPSSAVVKNAWSHTSTPPTRLHGEVLS
jgi:hypothetical protein